MSLDACRAILTNAKKLRILLSVLLGFCALLYYLFWWFEGGKPLSIWQVATLVIAIVYTVVQLGGNWTLYLAAYKRSRIRPSLTQRLTVDVLVTAYKEEYVLVRRCLEAACAMNGNHRVWLLDDGADPELARLAHQLGVRYLARPGSEDAKAGNLNYALRKVDGDVLVIFDIDHAPTQDFLDHTLIHFENPEIGFVQVMLTFENGYDGWVAQAGAESSLDFYNPTSIGADGIGSATLVGSNALIRRQALQDIGGYKPGLAEDLATSIALHAAGWRSLYVRKPLAPGFAPPDLAAWFTQQLKWARGVFEELLTSYPRYFKALNGGQRISYAVRMTYYWVGIVIGIHMVATIHALWSAEHTALVNFENYLMHFWPLGTMTIVIRQLALQRWFHPSLKGSGANVQWKPITLVFATWPIYILAWCMAILRLPLNFRATPKTKSHRFALKWVMPQLLSVLALALGFVYTLIKLKGQIYFWVYGFTMAQILAQLPVLYAYLSSRFTTPLAAPVLTSVGEHAP